LVLPLGLENLNESLSTFIPLSVGVIFAVLLCSIIIDIGLNFAPIRTLRRPIWILCAPGIALHELGHCFFSVVTGVPITEVNLFSVGKQSVGGHIKNEPTDSFISELLIDVGPAIFNGFVVSVIIYFLPHVNNGIAYYFIFAFTLGACPSSADLKCLALPFKSNPKKAFIQLSFLFIALIPASLVAETQVHYIHQVNWLCFVGVYLFTLAGLLGCYRLAE
jgi:hypothetical protein